MDKFVTWFTVDGERPTTDEEIKRWLVSRLRESADWLERCTLSHDGNSVFTGMGSPLGHFEWDEGG